MTVSVTVEIVNKKGLHARAAAKFVKIVASFQADVRVNKLPRLPEDTCVPGGSILGLMMLGADPGSQLKITAEGAQAQDVVHALKELIEGKFGEGE